MPATHSPSGVTGRGGMSRDILPQGDLIEVHITSIDPGKVFGPMNKNANFNFRLIIEGMMTIQPEGMPALTAGVGDIVYSPANSTSQVSNSGDTTLTYFVIQLKPRPASS
jgi:mannose-6-phosphate isomerase-like protein (cupin superfamily)